MSSASSHDLRSDVLAVAGISDAAVETRDGKPVVRVWLDGSREPDAVAADIRERLAGVGLRARSSVAATRPVPAPRRSGLGRGLDALIPAAGDGPPRAHLQPITPLRDAADPIQLDTVSVVESAAGVVVRAEDTAGRSAEVTSATGDVAPAVAAAVAGVLDVSAPSIASVDTRDVDGESLVTVVVDLPDGTRGVGSAIAGAGFAFTVGRAVWAALHHGDGPAA